MDRAKVIEKYNFHIDLDKDGIIDTMNHGYYPVFEEYQNQLNKYGRSLYHYMLQGINTQGLKILDVGCGRGGGTETLKNFGFSEIHGCDLVEKNIEYGKKRFDGINFKVGDAMDLDYEDSYFDIVLNVESSHCYDDVRKFLSETKRVLKPDGVFLYCDLSPSIEMHIENDLLFRYIIREDITDNVAQACRHMYEDIQKINESEFKNALLHIHRKKYDMYTNRFTYFIKYICSNQMPLKY